MKKMLLALAAAGFLSGLASARDLEIEQEGTTVSALEYGQGTHVLLALPGAKPGQIPNRKALKKLSEQIAESAENISVVAISWSSDEEVTAAVQYARENGAEKVSLLGHSRGAEMAGRYASARPDGDFDSLILLSSADDQGIPLTKTKKLFVYNKGDSYARWTPTSFEKSAEPKQILALDGEGHLVKHLQEERPSLIEDIVELLNR